MNLQRFNQPLTLKSLLTLSGVLLLGTALFFGGRALLRWMDSGPRSPQQVKREIRKFLVKQTHRSDFDKTPLDFDLKQTVLLLQTNLADLKQQLTLLQTNLAQAGVEVRRLRKEGLPLAEQARTLRLAVKAIEADTADRQQRLTNRLGELVLAQAHFLSVTTNVAARSNAVASLRASLAGLTNEISALLTNISEATSNSAPPAARPLALVALQKNLVAKQQELAAAHRQLIEKNGELAVRQRVVPAAQASLTLAQNKVLTLQTNEAAGLELLAAKRAAWQAKQKEVAANSEAFAAKQKEVAAFQEQLQTKQKDLLQQQAACRAKEQELAAQVTQFRTDIAKKVGEAASYENIYFLIGQQLWVVEKLLAEKDPIGQQQALSMALEASDHAAQSAEQPWLSARICEAYVLPNVALADGRGRIGYTPESLLMQCSAIFERAEELPQVARTFQILLERVTTNAPGRVENVRYQLGYAFERMAQFDDSLRCYRAVQHNTNLIKIAEQRIAVVEAKQRQQQSAQR